jgi:hypothetical protein
VTYIEAYSPRRRRSARLPGIEGSYAYCSEPSGRLVRGPRLLLRLEDEADTHGVGTAPVVEPAGGAGAKRGNTLPDRS